MDALQISGKWYISSRRAAKEHGYHSDYIGQLIRSGKVKGQKVGRSWYVLADSLTEYLGSEGREVEVKTKKHHTVIPAKTLKVHEDNNGEVIEDVLEEQNTAYVEEVSSGEALVASTDPDMVASLTHDALFAGNVIAQEAQEEIEHVERADTPLVQEKHIKLKYIQDEEPLETFPFESVRKEVEEVAPAEVFQQDGISAQDAAPDFSGMNRIRLQRAVTAPARGDAPSADKVASGKAQLIPAVPKRVAMRKRSPRLFIVVFGGLGLIALIVTVLSSALLSYTITVG